MNCPSRSDINGGLASGIPADQKARGGRGKIKGTVSGANHMSKLEKLRGNAARMYILQNGGAEVTLLNKSAPSEM